MTLLVDIFGYVAILLQGVALTAATLAVGGAAFRWGPGAPADAGVRTRMARLLAAAGVVLAAAMLLSTLLKAAVVAGTLEVPLASVLDAPFAIAGLIAAAGAAAIAFAARRGGAAGPALEAAGAVAAVVGLTLVSHAVARLDGRVLLAAATAGHLLAAALWVGGIPYFLIALAGTPDRATLHRIGTAFSRLAAAAVALLAVSGAYMAVRYLGAWDAVYGTAYGIMVATKALLLVALLGCGLHNALVVRRLARDPGAPVLRLRRICEVEFGLALAVLFAAASLTSVPPGIDLEHDRLSWGELTQRLAPGWPRMTSPDHDELAISRLQAERDAAQPGSAAAVYVPGQAAPAPRNASDIAWSEYNHHWAGAIVLAIGVVAFLARTGVGWAKHWPLLFLVLALFLGFRSDPESWPLGRIGFWEGFRNPEVAQHRFFTLVIIGFALFEWRVQTGRSRSPRAAWFFPLATAVAGTLLLAHSHAIANFKDLLVVEISHVPIALLGLAAGWARWLELRLPGTEGRRAGLIWPLALAATGVTLLLYREA
ncbi:MAG: copper resistance D family protein [Alphaproteobacteria bacterium]